MAQVEVDESWDRTMNPGLSSPESGTLRCPPYGGNPAAMAQRLKSVSPTILLRISDGTFHMHRSFTDFDQSFTSAEAYARAGYSVSMISATGRFLMGFDPRGERMAV